MPMCPIHSKEMRLSSKPSKITGTFDYFCPTKNPDGTYCSHKVKGESQSQATNGSPVAVGSAGAGSDYLLAAEALKFAATLYGVTPVELHEDAVTFAVKAFRSMKAVMS